MLASGFIYTISYFNIFPLHILIRVFFFKKMRHFRDMGVENSK